MRLYSGHGTILAYSGIKLSVGRMLLGIHGKQYFVTGH